MSPNKTLTTLASITALTFALGHTAVAEESPVEPTAAATPATEAVASDAAESAVGEQSAAKTSAVQEAEAETPPAEDIPAASDAPSEEAAAPVPPAAPAAAVEPPPLPPQVAAKREAMEQRFQERMAERRLRYDELRVRAKEAGIDLPETPPWEQQPMAPPRPDWMSYDEMRQQMAEQGVQLPESVDLTRPQPGLGPRPRMTREEIEAMREERYRQMRERAQARGMELPEMPPWKFMTEEEREAHWEKMRSMTLEERMAYREENWQKMRERAQEQGVELPEGSPWKQRMDRRQAMENKWKEYDAIIKDMTPEQREAAQAMYGSQPPGGGLPVSPRWGKRVQPPMMPPQGGYGPGQAYAPGYDAPSFGKGPAPSRRGFAPGVPPRSGYGPGAAPYGGQFGGEPSPGAYGPTPSPYGRSYGPGYAPDTGYGPGPGRGWGNQQWGAGPSPY